MNALAPFDGLDLYFAFCSFLLGTFFGSFFNVCIYRVPIKKSIVVPGSHCYHCGSFLSWRDNIPLISYLLLRGNCRFCGMHFSPRYFFVELLTGVLFLLVYLQFGLTWALPFHWAFVGLLIVGTFTDIDHFVLPHGITMGGMVFAIAAALVLGPHSLIADEWILSRQIIQSFFLDRTILDFSGHFIPFLWSLVGAGFGWGMLAGIGFLGALIFRKEAMGGGDVWLFGFLGAYLGPLNCIWILFLSSVLGSVITLTLIGVHKLIRQDEFEEFDLVPSRAVAGPGRDETVSGDVAEADRIIAASEPESGVSMPMESQTGTASESGLQPEEKPISLRIARRTARQMTQLPYGPYIAAAALIILLLHKEVTVMARAYFFLQPIENIEVKRAATAFEE